MSLICAYPCIPAGTREARCVTDPSRTEFARASDEIDLPTVVAYGAIRGRECDTVTRKLSLYG
jgi:hypothetical protein